MRKKHIVIHNEAELFANLDYCVYGANPESLPPIKFSKEMIDVSDFKPIAPKREVK